MASGAADLAGFVTRESVKHYENLATSGTGIIMVEYTCVDLSGRSEENQLGAFLPTNVFTAYRILQNPFIAPGP